MYRVFGGLSADDAGTCPPTRRLSPVVDPSLVLATSDVKP